MALFRTGLYVKNHSVEKVQVAKTPIASFNGNVTGLYIPELIAYIEAKQSGSGTPTPDNIRPIIGASECNVVNYGNTYTIQLGDTYYGGYLDVTTGVLTITWRNKIKLNELSWTYNSGSGGYFSASTPSENKKARGITNVICECYTTSSQPSVSNMGNKTIKGADNSTAIYIKDTDQTDETSLMNVVGDYYICYELQTPFTVQLTPTQIEQLLGTNNVWADTGDVEVKFYNVVR